MPLQLKISLINSSTGLYIKMVFNRSIQRRHLSAVYLSLHVALVSTFAAIILGTLQQQRSIKLIFLENNLLLFWLFYDSSTRNYHWYILRSAYGVVGVPFSTWTIIISHATFCMVVVYNNVVARLRRSSPNIIQASWI